MQNFKKEMETMLKRKLDEINGDEGLSEEDRERKVKRAKSDKHGLESATLKTRKNWSWQKFRIHNQTSSVVGALNCSVRERKGVMVNRSLNQRKRVPVTAPSKERTRTNLNIVSTSQKRTSRPKPTLGPRTRLRPKPTLGPKTRLRPKPRLAPKPQLFSGPGTRSRTRGLLNGLPPPPKDLSEIWEVPRI